MLVCLPEDRTETDIALVPNNCPQPHGSRIVVEPDAASHVLDSGCFRWKNRLLVMFCGDASTGAWTELRDRVRCRQEEVRERDLLLILVAGATAASPKRRKTAELHKRFGINANGVCVLLIGKDGTEKMRWPHVPDLDDVFARIDAMPMRQREMRTRKKKKED